MTLTTELMQVMASNEDGKNELLFDNVSDNVYDNVYDNQHSRYLMTEHVKMIGNHTMVFFWDVGNHGDNYLYWSTNPALVKQEALSSYRFKDNTHMQVVELQALPKDTQQFLIELCLSESKTLEAAEKRYRKQMGDGPAKWYVCIHIIFEITKNKRNDATLLTAKEVELESLHDQQFRDGYMNTEDACCVK